MVEVDPKTAVVGGVEKAEGRFDTAEVVVVICVVERGFDAEDDVSKDVELGAPNGCDD